MKQYLYQLLLITFAFAGVANAQANDVEQELAQRVQQAQVSGSDSDFYNAHKTFLNHLEQNKDWDKYYRVWMNRVIYDVNHKRFHRAFIQIYRITEDIRERHHIRSAISTFPICVWDSSISVETNQRWARLTSARPFRE